MEITKIILILFKLNTILYAQLNNGLWIENMENKFAIDISLNNTYETFKIKTNQTKYLLYPNTEHSLKLKLNYRFISMSIKYAPSFLPINGDINKKGKTNNIEIKSSIITKNWFIESSYSKVTGYYLKNTKDFLPSFGNNDPFIKFPKLNYTSFNITGGYILNKNFSLKHVFTQTQRQLKSCGSFIPTTELDYFIINDKSSNINTQKSNNIEFTLGPGYLYTFVFQESFYLTIGLISSIGYLHTKLTTRFINGDNISHQNNYIIKGEGKIGLGYNGKKIYMGIYSNISQKRYKQENTTVINTDFKLYYHLFFGIRLNSGEKINNFIDTIIQKLSTH